MKEKVKIPGLKTDATIEETVLVDQDGVKITAEELTYTGNTPKLKLLIENTSDQKVKIYSGTLRYDANSVNGYMFPGISVHAEVTPGNKATENVILDYEALQLYGIKEIGSIQMGFYVQDDDSLSLFPFSLFRSAHPNSLNTSNRFNYV